MPRIDGDVVENIRASADIVEIISKYIPLEQRGKNFFGVCPFHADHSPSMSVSREKQMYKCFSCGAAGNVFKFVSDIENISYSEAIAKVGEYIGITVEVSSKYQSKSKYEEEYQIMNLAMMYYQNLLNSEYGKKAKEYLKKRGLNEEMMKDFQMGLSISGNTLLSFLKQKNYTEEQLQNLGLINESYNKYHDIFINRIIFPIHNPQGKVVGFTARVYEGKEEPKYLNSKETVIFKKGNILFNYHRARDAIRTSKEVILVEGNMDAIRMAASGIKNTIALMGTAMTSDQVNMILKLRVPVVLMFDNDNAGLLATRTNGRLLQNAGAEIKVVRLEGEKDPDEYIINHGVEAMRENIKHAISFAEFEYLSLRQDKNLKDSKELASYVKEVLKSVEKEDDITIDVTLHKLVDEFHLSYEVLKKELEDRKTPIKVELPKNMDEKAKKRKSSYDISACHVLYAMMNDVKYIKEFKEKLGFFKEQKYRDITSEILDYASQRTSINLADFLSYAEESPLKKEIYEVIESINELDFEETSIEEYLYVIKKELLESEIKRLKEEQRNCLDSTQKSEIGMKIVSIKKKIEEMKKEVC